MILHTAEIRFWSKKSEPFYSWYLSRQPEGEGIGEELRTDHYLKTKSPNDSVKFRAHLLELKSRIRTMTSNTGKVETYVKESLKSGLGFEDVTHSDWIAVEKDRLIKKFEVNKDGIESVHELNGNGFELEFSRVEIARSIHFTICLEAQAEPNRVLEILELAVKEIDLARAPFLSFPSLGYGQFLVEEYK